MRTFQQIIEGGDSFAECDFNPDLILVFASRQILEKDELMDVMRNKYPDTVFFGCSTSGEIAGEGFTEDSFTYTAIAFDGDTRVVPVEVNVNNNLSASDAGIQLADALGNNHLRHVLVLSDGQIVNGTELVQGLNSCLPMHVAATGGLAGDGALFEKTLVLNQKGEPKEGLITALGLYGKDLEVGFGSMGGWEAFGVEREVTKSDKNVLYEIDGEPALELYKSFLGDNAKELPASALLFPLSMRENKSKRPLVRTILNINEEDQSLVFAGDLPAGSKVQFMKSNSYKLIDGAEEAARTAKSQLKNQPDLALLVSCVGRKLVMKQLTEEEVEIVKDTLGATTVAGFYSYGELAPFDAFMKCELHNQTMTITTLKD
jgi:hypothetical protein